ncbi:MAG: 3-keto-5-aminohexanoate cleavage protein [Anaerolineae bacterium]|jgi:3-keto-5-aminohexanoate cleavage enzyme
MDKLIITVTVDSSMSYPANKYCPDPTDVERVAEEYIMSVKSGASIVHMHGVHKLEDDIAADGRKLSHVDFDGWKRMKDLILNEVDAVIQFGIASARLDEKIRLMGLKPDMMSYCFNAHDEHFQPDPEYPANEIYATHPRAELVEFAQAAHDHGVKVEVESFHTGAFYNMRYVKKNGILPEPIWTTLFLGWPGGTWTPPTPQGLIFMVENLPKELKVNWNTSVMDPPTHWQVLTHAINMGGHVRVGWEDNPYLASGVYAKHCHELVDKIVRIAHEMGREIATPDEARQIIFGKK